MTCRYAPAKDAWRGLDLVEVARWGLPAGVPGIPDLSLLSDADWQSGLRGTAESRVPDPLGSRR